MGKIFLFMLLVVAIVLILRPVSATCSNSQIELTTQFTAIDSKDLMSVSDYQYPNYKEDDQIRIENIYLKNVGDCISENSSLSYSLITPDNQIISPFCNQNIRIPSLKQNEGYYIRYKNTSILLFDKTAFYNNNYIDSEGNEIDLCRQSLNREGIWKISPILSPIQTFSSNIKSKGWFYSGEFKVKSKTEILSLEQQEQTITLTRITIFVTIILGILSICFQYFLVMKGDKRRKDEEELKQKQILRSLEVLMNEIGLAIEGHKNMLDKKIIPSYFIPIIDSFYYISNIDSSICVGKKLQDTYSLKQALIKLENKIKNINRLIELAQNTSVNKKININNPALKELIKNTYYKDSEELLSILRIKWNQLERYN